MICALNKYIFVQIYKFMIKFLYRFIFSNKFANELELNNYEYFAQKIKVNIFIPSLELKVYVAVLIIKRRPPSLSELTP